MTGFRSAQAPAFRRGSVKILAVGLSTAVLLGRMITARDTQTPRMVFTSDEVERSIRDALDGGDREVAAALVDYLRRRDPARAAPLRARLVLSDQPWWTP